MQLKVLIKTYEHSKNVYCDTEHHSKIVTIFLCCVEHFCYGHSNSCGALFISAGGIIALFNTIYKIQMNKLMQKKVKIKSHSR